MRASGMVALWALALATLGGCATARPETTAHGLAVPAQWSGASVSSPAPTAPDWWTGFGSADLTAIVEQARGNGFDLAAAIARVRQAQASLRVAGAPLSPSLTASGTAERTARFSGGGSSSYEGGLTAEWQPDLWAGNRASRRSALALLDAAGHDRDAVELALVTETVSAWLATVAAQERTGIARSNLDAARRTLAMVESRQRAGSATPLELAQQRGLVASLEQRIVEIERATAENRIALAVLTGQPPQGFAIGQASLHGLTLPTAMPALPSDLLLHRPDIRAAERRLASADADIAVARAAMLPEVTLTAGAGVDGGRLSRLFDNPVYTLASALTAPIFAGGRLAGARDLAVAQREEVLVNYRQAIVTAFGEVEQALTRVDTTERERIAQAETLRQAEIAVRLAESRYKAGAETLLTLLDAQRTLYTAQEEALTLHLARLDAAVELIRVTGGGLPA